MKISTFSQDKSKRNLFIQYANSFMNFDNNSIENNESLFSNPMVQKQDKAMGIETLSIFPKEIIDGKTIITA